MKSKLFYEICQFLCTAVGDSFRFSFHHDPDQSLRAGGAYQDASIPGQCPLSSRDRVLQLYRAHDRLLLGIIRNRYIY